MKENAIHSSDNAQVKRARAVRDGKERESIFIEGIRLAEEAFTANLSIENVFYTEKFLQDERGSELIHHLRDTDARINLISEKILLSISDTRTPQGIVILAARPLAEASGLGLGASKNTEAPSFHQPRLPISHPPLVVIAHGVNNPANAGAIARTAEAAGASALVTTEGSVDLFSPKALRGAMGSTFRLPVWEGATLREALAWCAEHRILTVSTGARAKATHTEIDWTLARALILGSEGAGLSESEAAVADDFIKIPMRAPVESLNVAVACGIILYEAARQRSARGKR